MAVAYRSIGAKTANAGSGNITSVGLPAGHVANDILVLIVHAADNVACTVTGYTSIMAVNSGTFDRQSWFYKVDGGSESAPTVTHAAGNSAMARIVAVSGADTTTPIAANGQQADAATKTATAPTITPTAANQLIIFAATFGRAGDTSSATPSISTASGTDPTFSEIADDDNASGSNHSHGSIDQGLNTSGTALGARTAAITWDYTAGQTNAIGGIIAVAAPAAAATGHTLPALGVGN